jgi:phosphoheptose isomerase
MSGFSEFVDDYYRRFVEVLETFDRAPMQGVLEVLERIQATGGTIWVAGNGGSASIADHTACDATRGTYVDGTPPLRTVSLSSNVAMLTALSNDFSYEDCYWRQLAYYAKPGDAVLLVSSSGIPRTWSKPAATPATKASRRSPSSASREGNFANSPITWFGYRSTTTASPRTRTRV